MRCPACGGETPDGKRFCKDCGGSLAALCPRVWHRAPGRRPVLC